MGQFPGSNLDALQSGLGMGMDLGRAREQQQLNLLRLALMQDHYNQQNTNQQAQNTLGRDRLNATTQQNAATNTYRSGLLDARNDATNLGYSRLYDAQDKEQTKQQQRTQTSGENAQFITRNIDAPQAGQDYMQSGHEPDDFFQAAEGLQGQQQQYSGMTPEGQKPLIEQAKKAEFQRMADDRFAQRGQILTQQRLDSAHDLLDSLPENMRNDPQVRSNIMAQAYKGFHLPTASKQAAESIGQAHMTHQGYLEARSQHTSAMQDLVAFRSAHKDDLKLPTDAKGNPLPRTRKKPGSTTMGFGGADETDPRWARYDAATAEMQPLVEAEKQSKQQRMQAFQSSQQAKDRALGIMQPQQPGAVQPPQSPLTPGAAPQAPTQTTPKTQAAQQAQGAVPANSGPTDQQREAALDYGQRMFPNDDQQAIDAALKLLEQMHGGMQEPDHESEPDFEPDMDMDDADLEALAGV